MRRAFEAFRGKAKAAAAAAAAAVAKQATPRDSKGSAKGVDGGDSSASSSQSSPLGAGSPPPPTTTTHDAMHSGDDLNHLRAAGGKGLNSGGRMTEKGNSQTLPDINFFI
jgi:hypothetical protein